MSVINGSESIQQDKFVSLVTATAKVDLPLGDFHPRSSLRSPVHVVERPRFPVIDYHNHLDSTDPDEVLAVMDQTGVERIVNITMANGRSTSWIAFMPQHPDASTPLGGWTGAASSVQISLR
jgi:hypothetical protein